MTDNSSIAAASGDTKSGDPVRPLGWGRFLLQFVTVIVAYLACSVPPVAIAILMGGAGSIALALSTVTSTLGALLVAWLWLRSDGAVAQAFSLSPPANWPRAILIGLAGTATIIIIFQLGGYLTQALGERPPDVSMIMKLVTQSPQMLALWIILVAWGSAGFGEELLWRGFLFDRLQRLPGLRGNMVAVVLIQAVIFGLPHSYQGVSGMLVTGIVGIFLGWLRIYRKGNLWSLVIAHGMTDTLMLTLGYAQATGWKIPGVTG